MGNPGSLNLDQFAARKSFRKAADLPSEGDEENEDEAPVALFIGSHPDDIEIGAGGTAFRLIQDGWEVYFCILTREKNKVAAETREEEAREAARILGIHKERIVFCGLPDTGLNAGPREIDAIKPALDKHVDRSRIGLVFSHSLVDSHLDHKAAHALTPLVVKDVPCLYYPIVNHADYSSFGPNVFVDVSAFVKKKREALEAHRSQVELGRILFERIDEIERRDARGCRATHVEAYELTYVMAAPKRLIDAAKRLNCRRPRRWPFVAAALVLVACLLSVGYRFVPPLPGEFGGQGEVVLDEFRQGRYLAGRVLGYSPEGWAKLKVLVYVKNKLWYVHPWDSPEPGKGFATVDADGRWRIESVWHGFQSQRLALLVVERDARIVTPVGVFGHDERCLLSAVEPLTYTIVPAPDGL